MTLRLRNTILILLAAISAVGPVLIIRGLINGSLIFNLETVETVIPVILLSVFTTLSSIIIFLSFRNTASSEIFFFFIFLFSFAFDIFKLSDFELYGYILTKIVYYGRFLGALALFSAGLFTTGLEYRRMGITSIIIFILPAALVLVLPVDVTTHIPGGTYKIGRFHETAIALGSLSMMGIINFIIAGIKNESRDYLVIAAGAFSAACGRELIYYFDIVTIQMTGFLILLAGSIIFGLKTHRLYLWD